MRKPTKLQGAVISQLGYDIIDLQNKDSELWGVLEDVSNHGADTGWGGFTYYHNTVPFTKTYRKEIEHLVKDMASDMGEKPETMLAGFNCLKNYTGTDLYEAIGRFLYGGHYLDSDKCNSLQVYNALAWFALEETARQFIDEREAGE